MNGDAHHLNTGRVAIQHSLHGIAHSLGNFSLGLEENAVHCFSADHFAHGRFGGLCNGGVRRARIEEIVLSAGFRLDAVLDVELNVNDVLVVSKHQRLAQTVCRAAHADFRRTDAAHVNELDILNRSRQMPVDARHGRLAVGAECGDDARLTFGDDVKAAYAPANNGTDREHGN